MLGGMLPSTAEGIKDHLGAKLYGRSTRKAEKLGCALAVMSAHCQLCWAVDGFSTIIRSRPGTSLRYRRPTAGLLAHGSLKISQARRRVSRGGSTGVPFFSTGSIVPIILPPEVDFHDRRSVGPKEGEKASDYLRRQIREGRILVGFDVDDDGLGFACWESGRERFYLWQRFPHEVFNAQNVETKSPACSSAKD